VRRSWSQASRILARFTRVESCGAAAAKVTARMQAKARRVMERRREWGNRSDLVEVDSDFMSASDVMSRGEMYTGGGLGGKSFAWRICVREIAGI